MEKKTQKQCPRSAKDNSGCMSGLISIFVFRQDHYTQRLLSDRRHGSARHAGTGYKGKLNLLTSSEDKHKKINHDDRNKVSINLGPSVKILMEEEMSKVPQNKKIPNADTEQIREVSYDKNHCKVNETSVLSYDMLPEDKSSRMVPDKLSDLNTIERFSYNLHVAALLEDLCGDRHQCQRLLMDIKNSIDSCSSQKSTGEILCDFLHQPDAHVIQKHSTLHKLLVDMAEVLINQDSDSILSEKSHQSEELINALGILNPKELLLKLLQDPSSFLVKHIQEFKNDQEVKSSKPESCEVLEEWNVSSRQCEEPVRHKTFQKTSVRDFFRKKDRLQETKVSSENDRAQPLNKIVLLKPTPPRIQNSSNAVSPITSESHGLRTVEEKEKVASHFSLTKIKRRLKHVIGDNGKGQQMASMDGVLHIIPNESQPPGNSSNTLKVGVQTKSENKISHSKDHASQLSSSVRKKEKKLKLKETQSSVVHEAAFQNQNSSMLTASTSPLNREHNFQREARKHLVDMLTVVDSEAKSPARQSSTPLGRMLSLSEYNLLSPRLSPGREKETILSPTHKRFSPLWQLKQESGKCLSPLRESIQDSPLIGTTKTLDQVCDSNTNTQNLESISSEEISRQEILSSGEVSSPRGCTQSVAPPDTEHTQDFVTVLSKSTVGVPTNVVEGIAEERSLPPRADASEMSQTATLLVPTTPVTLLVHDRGSPDSIIEKPERPSPVSVLEPLFTEDISSPVDSNDGHVDFLVQPHHIPFEEQGSSTLVLTISGDESVHKTCLNHKESRFQYVRAVLEAAGLVQDGLFERWYSSSRLLSPSLYDEVVYLSDEFPDDLRHLFDSIDEVLEVTCEKLLSCNPWVSCAQPGVRPIPSGESLIKEVWKGMDLHSLSPSPHTLDQIVRRDMEVGTWMDLPSEVDGIGIFMEDVILDDIMEETLLEYLPLVIPL